MRTALLALALILGSRWAGAGTATAQVKERLSGTQKDLVKLQREHQQGQRALREKSRKAEELARNLSETNRKLEVARRDAMVYGRNLALVEDKLSRVHERIEQLEREVGADRVALEHSLGSLYRTRVSRGPLLLLSSGDPAELASRAHYLATLARSIHRRVRGLKERITEVDSYRREFHQHERELQRRRDDAESARQRAAGESQKKQAQLRTARSETAMIEALQRKREQSISGLQDMLDGLVREATRLADEEERRRLATGTRVIKVLGPTSVTGRGRLPWPVAGRLLSRFGKQKHPIFKTPVFNRGVEISAKHGSPITAVAKGVVVHASEMEGFGKLVVVDHGGRMMSVYGYASELSVSRGQSVIQGAKLAEVGEATASGQPSLYFEIRKGAKALDPLTYLGRR